MSPMNSRDAQGSRIPWPLLRLAALLAVMLVFGLAGLIPGVRAAGGALAAFAVVQVARRFTGTPTACEVSGQLATGPALLLAAVQAGIGLVMLGRPTMVLGVLGVPVP